MRYRQQGLIRIFPKLSTINQTIRYVSPMGHSHSNHHTENRIFFFFFLKTRFHFTALAGLELWYAHPCLLSVGIKGKVLYVWVSECLHDVCASCACNVCGGLDGVGVPRAGVTSQLWIAMVLWIECSFFKYFFYSLKIYTYDALTTWPFCKQY